MMWMEINLPTIYWKLGGRTKDRKIGQAVEKVENGKPVGRALWICDIEESVLTSCVLRSIKERGLLTGNPLKSTVMIGFDKIRNRLDLLSYVSKRDWIMQVDFSEYDRTVPRSVIGLAFDLIRSLFADALTHSILDYIQMHFVHSVIVLESGQVLRKHGGIPSGSGFTSLIGSICHVIISTEVF